MARGWNHNVQYHRLVLDAVPARARTALDAGTGDGLLAADLRDRVEHVTAIDVDAGVLDRARPSRSDVDWVAGDVMTHALPAAPFDVVASIATVHHLPDLGTALRRLGELTAPGGVLVVIGCARSAGPADFAMDVVGAVQHRVYSRTRGWWEHTAPVRLDFPHTYAQVRAIAATALPGVRWRRLPLFRYALTWSAPA
ncbi:class I SAM-dependent methyltransferase [Jiangella endophytica]|uniref:class I SAM-dependent methyltransferase n=1 Tax=Jiangella endophytica TaxID=1623398 RepID=UPI0018E5A0D4|nr:class I SAM-dependent methyltransferase [Jiangella endophytica]